MTTSYSTRYGTFINTWYSFLYLGIIRTNEYLVPGTWYGTWYQPKECIKYQTPKVVYLLTRLVY